MTVQRPTSIGDIEWVSGDPLSIRMFFHMPESDVAVDVSDAVFAVRVHDDKDEDIVSPSLVTTSLSAGVLRIQFTDSQIAELPRYAHLRLSESVRWQRTVAIGRLMESLAVGGTHSDPTIEDSDEISIGITVVPPSIGIGATWESLGAIIWDDLGSVTWEYI